jgi:hypothetical protein
MKFPVSTTEISKYVQGLLHSLGAQMTEPVIITVAITGALPRKKDTPAVPVTPSEQIESTHEAFEAGAYPRSRR